MKFVLVLAAFASLAIAGDLPTLMTTRGKLLVEENFAQPLPPPKGSPYRFASGFDGFWRYNIAERGGRWEVKEGAFTGSENPDAKHPATASRGLKFKDVIIQCEIRMNDVPLYGRSHRLMMVRTTDVEDYVCSVIIDEGGFRIQKDDNDHGGPDKAVPFGAVKSSLKLGAWHTVVFEILGEEMVATVNGKTLTGTHPLIASEKHSIMFVAGVEGSVRHFKVWEALPHPDWPKTKAIIAAKK